MSQTEFHTGKLVEVNLNGRTLEQFCEEQATIADIEKSTYQHTWEQVVRENLYDKFFFVQGKVYELVDHETEDDGEAHFCKLFPQPDGSVEFITQFYNGGTCLSEMIEGEFKSKSKAK